MYNASAAPIEFRKVRDFSEVISTGFQFVRQNWKPLYRPLLFICLPLYLIASVLFGSFFRTLTEAAAHAQPERMFMGMGSMLIGYVLMALATLLLYTMIYEYMSFYLANGGRQPSTGELWRQVRGKLLTYFAIGLIISFIVSFGFVLLVIPGIWLAIVYTTALPLYAFERAEIGDVISRPFKLVNGRWWRTFALVVLLSLLVGLVSYILYLPIFLVTGFGAMSGFEDPETIGSTMGLFISLMMALSGVVNVLLQPLLHVCIGLHTLSLIEEKEGRGLLERVDTLSGPDTAA